MHNVNNFRYNLLWFIPIGALALSFLHLPICYYGFMRFIITASAVYLAYSEYNKESKVSGFLVLFVIIALLFNPIVKVHLRYYQWQSIDAAVLAIYVVHFFRRRETEEAN